MLFFGRVELVKLKNRNPKRILLEGDIKDGLCLYVTASYHNQNQRQRQSRNGKDDKKTVFDFFSSFSIYHLTEIITNN